MFGCCKWLDTSNGDYNCMDEALVNSGTRRSLGTTLFRYVQATTYIWATLAKVVSTVVKFGNRVYQALIDCRDMRKIVSRGDGF